MKKVIKGLKILVGALIIVVSLGFIDKVLTYVLVDDIKSETRYAMKKFYEQNDIETLFVGSSHVYSGYVPSILDEELEENTYLLATPLQQADGSYYLLKEAIKNNDNLKTVYMDIYVRQYQGDPAKRTDNQMGYVYCISDYMKDSIDKVEYLLNASKADRYLDSFFVASRYGNHLFDLKYFERIIKSKRSDEYINGVPADKAGYEFYKGAWLETGKKGTPIMTLSPSNYEYGPISDEVISDYSLKYLDKMVKLCKKNDVELILTTTPFSDFFVLSAGNYTRFCDYMTEYARRNDVEFYDFNLCKIELLDLQDEDFVDTHHLSGVGAEKYSYAFSKIMKEYSKEERQSLFYNSVEEKMEALQERTFGILFEYSQMSEEVYEIKTVSNYNVDVEYRIYSIDAEGNEVEIIQEFSKNNILDVRERKKQNYCVISRDANSKEVLQEGCIRL